MRMSNRRMDNKFVFNVDIGDEPVNEVWWGDRQLYPANELIAGAVQLQMPEVGSHDWAYLRHAFDAVATMGGVACYMKIRFCNDSYVYGVNGQISKFPRANLNDGGLLTFLTDEGVPVQDLLPGSVAKLQLVVPERKGERWDAGTGAGSGSNSSPTWNVPFLAGTSLYFTCQKGQKKVCPHYWGYVYGEPSGELFGQCDKYYAGHGRGFCSTRFRFGSNIGHIEGDVGYRMTARWSGSCYSLTIQPIFPSFTKTLLLKVVGVTSQKN